MSHEVLECIAILENIYTVGKHPSITIEEKSGGIVFVQRYGDFGKAMYRNSVVFQFKAYNPFDGKIDTFSKMMVISDHEKSHFNKMMKYSNCNSLASMLGKLFVISVVRKEITIMKGDNPASTHRTRIHKIVDFIGDQLSHPSNIDRPIRIKIPPVSQFAFFDAMNPMECFDIIKSMEPSALYPIFISHSYLESPVQKLIEEHKHQMPAIIDARVLDIKLHMSLSDDRKSARLISSNLSGLTIVVNDIVTLKNYDYIIDNARTAIAGRLRYLYNIDPAGYFMLVSELELQNKQIQSRAKVERSGSDRLLINLHFNQWMLV